jgi:hypothetical protein
MIKNLFNVWLETGKQQKINYIIKVYYVANQCEDMLIQSDCNLHLPQIN